MDQQSYCQIQKRLSREYQYNILDMNMKNILDLKLIQIFEIDGISSNEINVSLDYIVKDNRYKRTI
jgi:hypothetical protein